MAVIEGFEPSKRDRFKIHPSSVVCEYKFFEAEPGTILLQLDTGGSVTRKNVGKQSQTMQLDRAAARQLWQLIGKHFGFSK